MKLVTASEMRSLDKKTIEEVGISSLVLMENAGSGIVRVLSERFGDLANKKIHILAGAGNNGGDGLVMARHLLSQQARPKVYLVGDESRFTAETKQNLRIFKNLGGEVVSVTSQSLPKLKFSLSMADIIVDAILGTGATGALRDGLAEIVGIMNEVNRPTAAVDVPTGIDSSTGEVQGQAVRADYTIALGFIKVGCLLFPARDYVGELEVVDIGIPHRMAEGIERHLLDDSCLQLLPERPAWGHKGTFGHTLVVAGSAAMAGAASLAAQAVLRGGGGLVTLAVPQSIVGRFAPGELIITPVPDTPEGTLGAQSIETLRGLLDRKDVLVIGPGITQRPEVKGVVEYLLTNWSGPVVIDADGLNVLTKDFMGTVTEAQRSKWILTPHPGEMARLVGQNARRINEKRLEIAENFAARWGVTVVLKGVPTIICGQRRTYINQSGNHGMGTGGMGDVLTGLIGALLSQGMDVVESGAVGAYVHGLAGDLAAENGARGLIASDCLRAIPRILG